MTNYDVGMGSGAILRLTVTQSSQSIAGNSSVDSWSLTFIKGSASSWSANAVGWSVNINGSVYSGSFTFDFRSYSSLLLAASSTTIGHNSDGTKTIAVQGNIGATNTSSGGPATVNGTFTQSTIPRASNPTVSPSPVVAGAASTLTTHRASTAFTHTITYTFGSATGTIGTGITDTVSWTPPLSLLSQIPNNITGIGSFTTTTYSGSTVIGTTTVNFTLTPDSSIIPTIGSITDSEAVSAVATAVGKYVQGLSKFALAITSAAGVYGSTIASYQLSVNGQTINAQSGTTPAVISASGSVVVTATVTDTRGRTASTTKTLTVLAYAPPVLNSVSVQRSLAGGTPDDSGTYLKVNINANASSLLNTTQRNQLNYRISTRPHVAGGSFVVKATVATGVIAFNSYGLVNPYAITLSWDIKLEIFDDFTTTAVQFTIPTAAIFQHWDAAAGVGIGKYRENGMLDVAGPIYQNTGFPVLDSNNNPQYVGIYEATVDPGWTYGFPYVTFTGTGIYAGPYKWSTMGDFVPTPGQKVLVGLAYNGAYYILGPFENVGLPFNNQLALPFPGGWSQYTGYETPAYSKSSLGIVTLKGLFQLPISTTYAVGTVIATLPVGFRPDTSIDFAVMFGPGSTNSLARVTVQANGQVVAGSALVTAGAGTPFLALDGIKFPAAGIATWTAVGASGALATFATNVIDGANSAYGTCAYWVDTLGFVWWRGQAKLNAAFSTDNTAVINLTGALQATEYYHMVTITGSTTAQIAALGTGNGTNALGFKAVSGAGTSGTLYSLAGIVYKPVNSGWTALSLVDGWSNYGTGYSTAAYMKRSDGLIMVKGLITAGTVGAVGLAALPVGTQPSGQGLAVAISNLALGRKDRLPAGMYAQVGSNTWFSLDSWAWQAEQ